METENGRPPDPDEPPGVHVTLNQVVAWNIAYYRKAAGLTQEELGKLLGRSKRLISADERSWDGAHTREFNAQDLGALSVALGIPVIAFFLPPEDDGADVRYLFRPPGADEDLDMGDLMLSAMPDTDADTTVMGMYRYRLALGTRRYLHPSWGDAVEQWSEDPADAEIRAEQAADLRADREALLRIAAKLAAGIERLEKGDEG